LNRQAAICAVRSKVANATGDTTRLAKIKFTTRSVNECFITNSPVSKRRRNGRSLKHDGTMSGAGNGIHVKHTSFCAIRRRRSFTAEFAIAAANGQDVLW
jgi:hypothetical protein